MLTETQEIDLSDEDVGLLVEDRARKLRAGETSRDQFRDDLVSIIARDPSVIVREGPIRDQGRVSFGLQHEGAEGAGLFILEDGPDGDR